MARPPWYRDSRLKLAVKLALGALVLAAVGRQGIRAWAQLGSQGRLVRVDWGWIAASMAGYLGGLLALGLVFSRVMDAGPTPVGRWAAIRAYLVSHLGKYVPGKALVVVMRVGLVTPYGARPASAAFATLYETLMMMAAGGLLSAAVGAGPSFDYGSTIRVPAGLVGLGIGLSLLVVVWPGVFPRLATLARLPFPGVGPDALPRLSGRLLAQGLATSTVGWGLLGLSQVAVLRSIGVTAPLSTWPSVVGAVALATVAGFVVPIAPGGLGVREWVLWTTLGAVAPGGLAVVAAILLRLTWLAAEVLAAVVALAIRPAVATPC